MKHLIEFESKDDYAVLMVFNEYSWTLEGRSHNNDWRFLKKHAQNHRFRRGSFQRETLFVCFHLVFKILTAFVLKRRCSFSRDVLDSILNHLWSLNSIKIFFLTSQIQFDFLWKSSWNLSAIIKWGKIECSTWQKLFVSFRRWKRF
jgi:hypothetical protein